MRNAVYWRPEDLLVRDHDGLRIVSRLRIDDHWKAVMSEALCWAAENCYRLDLPAMRIQLRRDLYDNHSDLSNLERRIILDYATHAAEA